MTKQRAFEIAVAAYRACAAKGCPDCQKDLAEFDAAQRDAAKPMQIHDPYRPKNTADAP
jgi:hypothetical protein